MPFSHPGRLSHAILFRLPRLIFLPFCSLLYFHRFYDLSLVVYCLMFAIRGSLLAFCYLLLTRLTICRLQFSIRKGAGPAHAKAQEAADTMY